MDIIEQPKFPGAPVGLAKWKSTSAATAPEQVQTTGVAAVTTGSSPTDVLLQMDAAVDIILEGFTGDERKRREHALNLIMTLMAVETIALRKTMEELKELKTAEIIAGLKGSNIRDEPRAKRVGSGPWLGASGASTTQGAEPTQQANDHP